MQRGRILFAAFSLLACWFVFACTGIGSSERTGSVRQAIGEAGETVLVDMDASTLTAPASVTVTWSALPGNLYDWIAISPQGSGAGSFQAYVYTNGATSGSTTFNNIPAGNWVARAYRNNTYEIMDESPMFTVASGGGGDAGPTTVTTNASTYQSSQTATVTYSNMQGNLYDWISIAPQGSDPTEFTLWTYTNGQINGTANFALTGLNGTYVARAYFNNGYTIAAESAPFTVGTYISTNASAYPVGGLVTVTFSNLPGNQLDWISIAPQGSPATTYEGVAYTNGEMAGTRQIYANNAGTYVARAYVNDSFTILYESAPFTVGGGGDAGTASVSTNAGTYTTADTITVNWAGAPGNTRDWIALSPAGSNASTYSAWAYINGAASGSMALGPLAAGTYEARLYVNDSFTMIATSATFTVTGGSDAGGGTGGDGGAAGVTTSGGPFSDPATVTVNFYNLPGNQYDWIAIAPAGGAPGEYVSYQYTNGAIDGSRQFTGIPAGTWVARAFQNNGFTMLAESPSFVVSPVDAGSD